MSLFKKQQQTTTEERMTEWRQKVDDWGLKRADLISQTPTEKAHEAISALKLVKQAVSQKLSQEEIDAFIDETRDFFKINPQRYLPDWKYFKVYLPTNGTLNLYQNKILETLAVAIGQDKKDSQYVFKRVDPIEKDARYQELFGKEINPEEVIPGAVDNSLL